MRGVDGPRLPWLSVVNGHLPKFLAVAMATLKSHQAYTLKVWQLVSTEEEEELERQVEWPGYKDKIHTSTQLLALSPALSQTAYFPAGSVEFKRGLGKASEGLWGLDIKRGPCLAVKAHQKASWDLASPSLSQIAS